MLHSSTIEPSTLEVLKKLQQLPSLQDTRLVGGTALALQLGHRKSVDIDLFGAIHVDPDILVEELISVGSLQIIKNTGNIHIFLLDNIKVDIVNYKYEWLASPVQISGIRMAAVEDICAMKLAAVTGRGSKKDFIDIYYLSRLYTLDEMLVLYAAKYPEGSSFLVLKSLAYFEDADPEPDPYMLQPVSWELVKERIVSLLGV